MRHLFVTQDYGPDLGGMARRHVEICRRLSPDSVTVSTVAAGDGGAFDAGERYVIARQPFPFDRAKRFGNQLRWGRALVPLARGSDVMHCANIRPVGYAAWWAHRRTGIPYLLYVNGGDLLREKQKRSLLKRRSGAAIFRGAAGIVATSEWVAALAREVIDAWEVRDGPPVRALALGTDPQVFHPRADQGRLRSRWSSPDAPMILTVGRLVPHKGQDVVIRAAAQLREEFPTLRYVIVGGGDDESRLRELAGVLGFSANVVFAGPLADADLPEAYATATVYAGISRLDREVNVEGFGISFLEASASGVPVVAGDSGGVRSAVRDGETGLVVNPTDVNAVAGAIRLLLRDPLLRARLGANGRRAVEEFYNWDRVARDTRDFAREVFTSAALKGRLMVKVA